MFTVVAAAVEGAAVWAVWPALTPDGAATVTRRAACGTADQNILEVQFFFLSVQHSKVLSCNLSLYIKKNHKNVAPPFRANK